MSTNAIELKVEDLEVLLSCQLGSNIKTQSFTSHPLTAPGDNYGSTILSVEVNYEQNSTKEVHTIPLVAKLVPLSPFLREVFHINITFNKEVRAYKLVSPEFERLQKEKNIPDTERLEVFPKFYGARTNWQGDENSDADESAVLLLENLKVSGYRTRDRRKGLNLKHVEAVLTQLARFHALSVALKLLKPQVFRDTVLKACEQFDTSIVKAENDIENWVNATVGFVKNTPECVPYLSKIEAAFRKDMNGRLETSPPPKEPFATLVHNDFWVNNMMFKYNTGDADFEAPAKIKFVDFQITVYDSPVRDLLFFIFTSAEDGIVNKHFDHLIRHYHSEFINFLVRLGCNTDLFSFERFSEEIDTNAPKEFAHILFMLNVVSADKSEAQDLTNYSTDNLLRNNGGEVYSRKVEAFILTYVSKGWL